MDEEIEISLFRQLSPFTILFTYLGPFDPLIYCNHIFHRIKKFAYHFGDDKYRYYSRSDDTLNQLLVWNTYLNGIVANGRPKKLAHLTHWQKTIVRKDIYEKTLGKFIRTLLRWEKFSELISLINFVKWNCDQKTYYVTLNYIREKFVDTIIQTKNPESYLNSIPWNDIKIPWGRCEKKFMHLDSTEKKSTHQLLRIISCCSIRKIKLIAKSTFFHIQNHEPIIKNYLYDKKIRAYYSIPSTHAQLIVNQLLGKKIPHKAIPDILETCGNYPGLKKIFMTRISLMNPIPEKLLAQIFETFYIELPERITLCTNYGYKNLVHLYSAQHIHHLQSEINFLLYNRIPSLTDEISLYTSKLA